MTLEGSAKPEPGPIQKREGRGGRPRWGWGAVVLARVGAFLIGSFGWFPPRGRPMAERAIRLWLWSSVFWLAPGPLLGVIQSLQFLIPGSLDSYPVARVDQEGVTVDGVLETHAHADPLSAAPFVRARLGMPPLGVGEGKRTVRARFKALFSLEAGFATDGPLLPAPAGPESGSR